LRGGRGGGRFWNLQVKYRLGGEPGLPAEVGRKALLFRVATDTKRMRMETKAAVRALLERLPDDCTMDDVLYHLYVLDRIERGLAEADAGRTIPHDQVAEEMRRRWLLGAAE